MPLENVVVSLRNQGTAKAEGKGNVWRGQIRNGSRAGVRLALALGRAQTGPIIAIMSPVLFTPEKECYSVLFL